MHSSRARGDRSRPAIRIPVHAPRVPANTAHTTKSPPVPQAHSETERSISTAPTAWHEPAVLVIEARWPRVRRGLDLSSRLLNNWRCRGLGKERKRVLTLVRGIKCSMLQGPFHERGRQALPFRGDGYGFCSVRGTGGSLR
jgi:hypothetical protein